MWRRLFGSDAQADQADSQRPRRAPRTVQVALDTRSVWFAAWAVIAALAIAAFVRFVFTDGGSIFFSLTLAFFFALAIEPVVGPLSRRMPRPAATAITFVAVALFTIGFFSVFGRMLTEQLAAFIRSLPDLITSLLATVNARFGTTYTAETALADLGVTSDKVTTMATSLAGGVVGLVSNTLGFALNAFSFAFLAYFLSAGLPNLRAWIAGLLHPRAQVVFHTVWQLMIIKVGGYVAARMTLAVISGTISGVFMALIGLPYWLPLALWTGIVAQFVPTVGTYIAIALPVIVGIASDEPMDGVWMLVFAIVYQQIENVTIEPRISARAVDLHPAVSFVAALLGASLFGVTGALVGVPMAATIIALFDIYSQRYEVSSAAESEASAIVAGTQAHEAPKHGGSAAREAADPRTQARTRARGTATAESMADSEAAGA